MTRTKNKTMHPTEPPWRAYAGPIFATLVFAAMILVYMEHKPAYMAILRAINEHPFRTPFLDTRFVTAQNEC